MTHLDLHLILAILGIVLAAAVLPPAAGTVVLAYLAGLLTAAHVVS